MVCAGERKNVCEWGVANILSLVAHVTGVCNIVGSSVECPLLVLKGFMY